MKLPTTILRKLEHESKTLDHGVITLSIHIRNFNASRFVLHKEESLLASELVEVQA